jgi:hypothetical protein
MLPPQDLLIPILATEIAVSSKSATESAYVLCRTCAEQTKNTTQFLKDTFCQHSVEERTLAKSVYALTEIAHAISKGYVIQKLFSVRYTARSKIGVFDHLFKVLSKNRLQYSGFPRNVESVEDKQKYVDLIRQEIGVDLKVSEVTDDPIFKKVCKLANNMIIGTFNFFFLSFIVPLLFFPFVHSSSSLNINNCIPPLFSISFVAAAGC